MSQTDTLLAVLRRHYIKPGEALPGGVFVPECGINGSNRQSRADALYAGFTSTSGRILIGHELKVSRADWRKELDSPGKADFWADNCHAWYVVAPGSDIVQPDEVPAGWGLMVPSPRTKTRMQILVKASVHGDRVPSWQAMRSVLARLDTLRATEQAQYRSDLTDKIRREVEERHARMAARNPQRSMTAEERERLHVLERLEDLLGQPLTLWGDDDAVTPALAQAALAVAQQAAKFTGHQRYAVQSLERWVGQVQEGIAAYGKAMSALGDITGGDR